MKNLFLSKKHLLILLFTFASSAINATEVVVNNIRYLLSSENKTATILACNYNPDTLDIPEYIEYNYAKYTVKKIASGAFPDNSSTVKLSIPNSVVTIESGAFGKFSALRDIFVGSGVDSISGYYFPHNKYIETYRINNQNILDKFCMYVKQGATSIETKFNMVVGDDISIIGEKAFATNGYVSDFWMKTLTLGKSVTQINSTFNDCTFLEEVCVPNLLQWCNIQFRYSNGVNYGKLKIGGEYITDLVIPEGVEKINDHAFEKVRQLTSLTLPSTIKEIGDSAFYWCSQISAELEFPENIKIGKAAFYYCGKIKGIKLPDTINSIGNNAFYDCNGLEYISVSTNTPNEILSCFTFLPLTNLYLRGDLLSWMLNTDYYNPISGCQHLFLNGEEIVDLVIPEGIGSVYSSFRNCDGIRSVAFPYSCYKISDNAFEGCDNIRTLYLTENIDIIGASVFGNSIDNNMTIHTPSLSAWLKIKFGNSWNWNSTIPQNCNIIVGGKPLEGTLEIPSDITTIQNGAFYQFKNINKIIIHSDVTNIGAYAFVGNDNLSEVFVYSNVPAECQSSSFSSYANCVLYVPKGCTEVYSAAPGWSNFANIVEIDESNSINDIVNSPNEHYEYYSINGTKLRHPQKGIIIRRDTKGRTKRILIH